jgi:hypothetical protein
MVISDDGDEVFGMAKEEKDVKDLSDGLIMSPKAVKSAENEKPEVQSIEILQDI